eukprot:2890317-Rhodomonas_salina.1
MLDLLCHVLYTRRWFRLLSALCFVNMSSKSCHQSVELNVPSSTVPFRGKSTGPQFWGVLAGLPTACDCSCLPDRLEHEIR